MVYNVGVCYSGSSFSTGDPAAVQQKIRLDVPGIT
jgi:hypothetical protein